MKQWIFINEEGADRLIRDSEDKPRAMLFRDWMWSQTHPGETPPDFEEEEASSAPREITPADEAAFAGNPILKFTNEMFGEVRVLEHVGTRRRAVVAVDVCRALEIGNPSQALTRLDNDEKKTTLISNESAATGKSQMAFVNEPGVYTLVLGSRKPEAKTFKRWIAHEVIPSICKHGAYLTDEVLNNILADPDFGIRLLTEIKEERERNRVLTEESGNLPRPTTFPLNSPWSGTAGAC